MNMFLELNKLINKIKEYFFPKLKGEKLDCLTCGVTVTYPDEIMTTMSMERFNEFNKQLFEEARKVELN